MSTRPYKINFFVNDRSIGLVSVPTLASLTTLEALTELLVGLNRQYQGCGLSFAWEDEEGDLMIIPSDFHLERAVYKQTMDGSDMLFFHVIADEIPPPPSEPQREFVPLSSSPYVSSSLNSLSPYLSESTSIPPFSSASSAYERSSAGSPHPQHTDLLQAMLDAQDRMNEKINRLVAMQEKKDRETNTLRAEMEAMKIMLMDAHSRLTHLSAREREIDELKAIIHGMQQTQLNGENSEKEELKASLLPVVRRCCAEAKKKNLSPLYLAAQTGDVEGVQALLQCTYDLVTSESEDIKAYMRDTVAERINNPEEEQFQFTPLHIAASHGHTETVSLLLTHGANTEVKNKMLFTPLHVAADNGHEETVSLLLTHRANTEAMDEDKCTPLHFAVFKGHEETVSLLLTHRANTEAKNVHNSTVLHAAAGKGHEEIVSLLLTHRANIESTNGNQFTPLHEAVSYGHTETVSLLLAHGANTEAKGWSQFTPLHYAVNNRHTEIVSLLLTHRANIDAKDKSQRTPLHIAASDKNGEEIVSDLIAHRADIEAKNSDGQTPLDIAINEEIKDLLRNAKK